MQIRALSWRRTTESTSTELFFYQAVQVARLNSTSTEHSRVEMGLGIEFDKRLLTDTVFRKRLEPYLGIGTGPRPRDS